ncbi:hypothetical protein [Burkholderia pseudomallei]|uniref:hypothetical protein n=1 Tax=Burkholderia pseudomallei TaxID=28450 RepID=UPI000B16B6C3|nr:hypothetical protein [Burkholderia pseudomallei]
MKTIELIGGMSWESSAAYYRPINPRRTARLGGHRNARSIMATVCRDEIETRRHAGRRDEPGRLGQRAARQAEAGGADFILLCTHDAQGRARDRGRAVRAVRAHRRSAPALTAGCARRFVTIVRGAQGGFGARLIGSGGDDAACAARIPAGGRDFSFVAGLKIPVRAGGGAGSVKLGGDRFPTLCALAAQCSIPSRSAIGYRCT